MRILFALLLAIPLAAAASPIEVFYVVGTGTPNGALFCFDGRETTQSLEPASVGGACTQLIDTGAPVVVEAIDDRIGQVRFYYDLRANDPDAACAHGFVLGPFALDVPVGCEQLTVAPEVGSLTGVVRISGT